MGFFCRFGKLHPIDSIVRINPGTLLFFKENQAIFAISSFICRYRSFSSVHCLKCQCTWDYDPAKKLIDSHAGDLWMVWMVFAFLPKKQFETDLSP